MSERKTDATGTAEVDPLRLEDQLCFALYAATRAMTRTFRVRLEPLGLTYPQYLVMIVLWEQDGLSIKQIGERLMLDSGTLTPLLKRLEAMKLLRRERAKLDEREVRITLTKEGRKMREAALDVRRYVECRVQMSETEITALRADIMGLVDRLGMEAVPEAAE
jgi:DNA-binding MarR family transcriptional regulator